jgi:methionyl-tRNA formyltransferase
MDAGPIVRQDVVHLHGNEHAPVLLQQLIERGTRMLVDVLPGYFVRSNILNPHKKTLPLSRPDPRNYGIPNITTDTDADKSVVDTIPATLPFLKIEQDHHRATPAHKISTDESFLNFAHMTAQIAHNRTRAFSGWPGVWATLSMRAPEATVILGNSENLLDGSLDKVIGRDEVKVKIISTVLLPSIPAEPQTNKIEILKISIPLHKCPVWDANSVRVTFEGETCNHGGDAKLKKHPDGSSTRCTVVERHALRVVCADGHSLGILHLQPAGKRVMDARSFVNGLQGRTLEWA